MEVQTFNGAVSGAGNAMVGSGASPAPARGAEWAGRVHAEVQQAVVGQDVVIERALVALLADGHVLIEGMPGLAKTLLVKSLAAAMGVDFERVQFTPDLLPADVVGTMVFQPQRGEFTTHKGPIFANLVLADEINRAPAKVQSALLEAMQERQVTIGLQSYRLPDPFLVLATQNPIEQEGTYPLPEAQLDRFMFLLKVDYPDRSEEVAIVQATTREEAKSPVPVLKGEEIVALQGLVRRLPVSDYVVTYAADLVRASRPKTAKAPKFINDYVTWGAGPRATQYLVLGAKARALLDGRVNVSCNDIKAVAYPVLRHRLFTNFNADAEGITSESIVEKLLQAVPEPEAKDLPK